MGVNKVILRAVQIPFWPHLTSLNGCSREECTVGTHSRGKRRFCHPSYRLGKTQERALISPTPSDPSTNPSTSLSPLLYPSLSLFFSKNYPFSSTLDPQKPKRYFFLSNNTYFWHICVNRFTFLSCIIPTHTKTHPQT